MGQGNGEKGKQVVALVPFGLFPFYPFLNRRAAICDDAHDVGIGNELAINFSFATHPLHSRADAQGGDLEPQRIAGHYGFAETRLPDACKQDQLRVAVCNFPQRQHCSHLCQCFDNQHTGHDGRTGKVALKKGLVDADLFNADDEFPRDQLYDPIDEEKGKTVRQELLYRLGIENSFHDGIKRRGTQHQPAACPRL